MTSPSPAPGVFSSDEFLDALNRVWCNGHGTIANVAVGDHVVRTVVANDRPLLDIPFLDFFEPIPGATATIKGRYTPRVVVNDHPAADLDTVDQLVIEPAPYIRWRQFESWDAVVAHWKQSERAIERESRRRERILARDHGDVAYELDDRDPKAFDACIAWKSQQFLSVGAPDPFEQDPRNVQLMRALIDNGIGKVSSLRAGDRIVASHIGLDWNSTIHWWLPTYDDDVRSASPGRLLLQWVLQQAYERDDDKFDFLRGDAPYKWIYATHFRDVVDAGRRPLNRQLELTRARMVQRFPGAADAARSLRGKVMAKASGNQPSD